ncbi:hypothetical protein [Thioalbus denitrificans]|uniref:Roadblock/LC7 domain-containing protein n=1 Tax=Thioalbus denitrificans TaxID=547122 RepID=A0A369CMN0_9GAMM|nr:hypothetical protein [Thioalbus denitrificans]RCX33114.1 hypothetical protein DFQ59_101413 [Thioalbus denitrificans]
MSYRLIAGHYLAVSPAGAYHAAAAPDASRPRTLLTALLRRDETPPLELEGLRRWCGVHDNGTALDLLHHLQTLGWLEGLATPRRAPGGPLEQLLPELLAPLSAAGRALLADAQGFYLASVGFPHEAAEEISALSADLASLHARHHGLLGGNLGLPGGAWGVLDAAGNSQFGFWPIHAGGHRFVLALAGQPRLNQPALTRLVWALWRRYGATAA